MNKIYIKSVTTSFPSQWDGSGYLGNLSICVTCVFALILIDNLIMNHFLSTTYFNSYELHSLMSKACFAGIYSVVD